MKTKTTSTSFIQVSTDSDHWGTNPAGFACVAEACRIRDAAEAAGAAVAFDTNSRAVDHDDNGNQRHEIDWFSEWCSAGYGWTDEEWIEWFRARATMNPTTQITLKLTTNAGANATRIGDAYAATEGVNWRNATDCCDSDGNGRVFLVCDSVETTELIEEMLETDDDVVSYARV